MIYTNKYNIPEKVCEAIRVQDQTSMSLDQGKIRVSDLLNAPYQRQLLIRFHDDLVVDYFDRYNALMGTGFHKVMESISSHNRLMEEKLEIEVEGMMLKGRPDVYEDGVIEDYKTTKAWALVFNDRKRWEQQLNVYAYLFRRHGFPVTKLQILCAYKDWNPLNVKMSQNYPCSPCHHVDIPLWEAELQRVFVETKVRMHKRSGLQRIDEIEECTAEERWASPDVWAVYRSDKHKRAMKLFDTEMMAKAWASQNGLTRIEKREGEERKCTTFCNVRSICPHGKSLAEAKAEKGTSREEEE